MQRQLLALLVSCFVCGPLLAESPESVRLFVVDVSHSMEVGDTIGKVREELIAALTIEPPTNTNPVAFITFASSATKPKVFRTLDTTLAFVQKLHATRDSTSIAAGLNEAITRLKQLDKVERAAVLLYTDDLDGDREKIEAAETKLDDIFQHRLDKGLQQSLILRNWSNVPAESSVVGDVLGEKPFVSVLDGSQPLVFTPTIIHPNVTLVSAERDQADPAKLLITYQPELTVDGELPDGITVPPYRFESSQDDTPDNFIYVAPNATSPSHTITVSLSDATEQAAELNAKFTITPQKAAATSPLLVPFLSATEITLVVPIPPLVPAPPQPKETTITVTFGKILTPPRWHQLPNAAAFQVELQLDVDGPVPADSKLGILCPPEISYFNITPDTFQSGTQTCRLDLIARLEPSPQATTLRFHFEPPPNTSDITINPVADLEFDVLGPSAATLAAQHRGQTTSTLRTWVMSHATTAQLPLLLTVDGPVTRQFTDGLRLQCQRSDGSTVNDLRTFHPEPQTVCLPPSSASYLEDETITVQMPIIPELPTLALRPLTINAEIVRQAPFKYHLLIGCCILAATLGPFMMFRLFLVMSPKPSTLFGDDDES